MTKCHIFERGEARTQGFLVKRIIKKDSQTESFLNGATSHSAEKI